MIRIMPYAQTMYAIHVMWVPTVDVLRYLDRRELPIIQDVIGTEIDWKEGKNYTLPNSSTIEGNIYLYLTVSI